MVPADAQRPFILELPWGQRLSIPLPHGPIGLAQLARLVLPVAQACCQQAQAQQACTSQPVRCGAACGACCRQLVTISTAEAFMLREIVQQLPPLPQHRVQKRFREIEASVKENDLTREISHLDDPALSDQDHYALAGRYFQLGQACPFLEVESCSIYDQRPALCREYLVTTPPEGCSNPFVNDVHPVATLPVSQALHLACAQLLGTEVWPIPLGLASSWVREHQKWETLTWDAYRLLSKFELCLEAVMFSSAPPPGKKNDRSA